MRINHQIRQETPPVFYGGNAFQSSRIWSSSPYKDGSRRWDDWLSHLHGSEVPRLRTGYLTAANGEVAFLNIDPENLVLQLSRGPWRALNRGFSDERFARGRAEVAREQEASEAALEASGPGLETFRLQYEWYHWTYAIDLQTSRDCGARPLSTSLLAFDNPSGKDDCHRFRA